jgi:hypothetical protein
MRITWSRTSSSFPTIVFFGAFGFFFELRLCISDSRLAPKIALLALGP